MTDRREALRDALAEVVGAAQGWEAMWDSLRESGVEPVLCPEEARLDRAVQGLRRAMAGQGLANNSGHGD